MNLGEFEHFLRELFPIGSGEAKLEFVSANIREGKEPTLRITIRLLIIEECSIRSIKEQEVWAGTADLLEWHQLEIYFRAYEQALSEILRGLSADKAELLMPSHLFPKPFELKRSQTIDDYRKAFLVKSRLGKLL
jgi:hypothetical protein